MAYGDYYNPANKVVNSGDVVYASDINDINSAIDAGFEQVALDITEISTGSAGVSQAWAEEEQGTRPDILVDGYSSKAYAIEAKGWATSAGEVLEASTGLPLSGSSSAKTYAASAGSHASSASASAGTATTQAGISTAQAVIATTQAGTATTQAGTATTQAGNASTSASLAQDWASKAVDSVVSGGKYSALHYAQKASDFVTSMGSALNSIAALTPAADKIPYYTGASTAALTTLTAAGRSLISGADAAAQRTTLGLGNVPNVDCRNGSNISSGTIADARIASTLTRDSEVNTATTTALSGKAGLSSPTFTGTPLAPTAATGTNTTQIATTAFVVGQRGVNSPVMNGTAVVGSSYLYAREDHVHPSDTTKAALASPSLTGTPLAPTAAVGTSTTQIATTAFVQNARLLPVGTIIDFAGTNPPSGFLTCPPSPTNISRVTYAALFAAIGTTWGVGDGATTFGLPYFPAGFTTVAGASGTSTAGLIQDHTHPIYIPNSAASVGGSVAGNNGVTSAVQSVTGNNLAAAMAVLKCIRY